MPYIQEPVKTLRCPRCAGCGQIDDCKDGEPWIYWETLPPGADLAVRMGIVKPIPCPVCKGAKTIEMPEVMY